MANAASVQRIRPALACGRGGRARRRPKGNVHCPAHDDANPSLSGNAGKNGLAQLERERRALLHWAASLAERGAPLPRPVQFSETPLRHITLQDGGMLRRYVTEKLKFLALAYNYRDAGGPGQFPPQWWQAREQDALNALAALREALETQQREAAQP